MLLPLSGEVAGLGPFGSYFVLFNEFVKARPNFLPRSLLLRTAGRLAMDADEFDDPCCGQVQPSTAEPADRSG
jgi:hypothetical protein